MSFQTCLSFFLMFFLKNAGNQTVDGPPLTSIVFLSLLWKSIGTIKCLVLKNIFFSVSEWVIYIFVWTIPLKMVVRLQTLGIQNYFSWYLMTTTQIIAKSNSKSVNNVIRHQKCIGFMESLCSERQKLCFFFLTSSSSVALSLNWISLSFKLGGIISQRASRAMWLGHWHACSLVAVRLGHSLGNEIVLLLYP